MTRLPSLFLLILFAMSIVACSSEDQTYNIKNYKFETWNGSIPNSRTLIIEVDFESKEYIKYTLDNQTSEVNIISATKLKDITISKILLYLNDSKVLKKIMNIKKTGINQGY